MRKKVVVRLILAAKVVWIVLLMAGVIILLNIAPMSVRLGLELGGGVKMDCLHKTKQLGQDNLLHKTKQLGHGRGKQDNGQDSNLLIIH